MKGHIPFNLVTLPCKPDSSSSELMDIMDSVIEKINKIEALFKNRQRKLKVNRKLMETLII